jgi:hypothetical protein
MKQINAKGGGDYEEAIEIGFQHAYQEHLKYPLSAVILIADAPAKEFNAIVRDRKKYGGENTWN